MNDVDVEDVWDCVTALESVKNKGVVCLEVFSVNNVVPLVEVRVVIVEVIVMFSSAEQVSGDEKVETNSRPVNEDKSYFLLNKVLSVNVHNVLLLKDEQMTSQVFTNY